MNKKVTLFLMGFKGLKVLEFILTKFDHKLIDKVIVGTDKNVKDDYSKEIVSLCDDNQIKWSDRKDEYEIAGNYIIAISWRWIINSDKIPVIVIHESMLPKYRGFAPLVNQLVNGEKTLGVSSLFASNEYDKGNIIFQAKTNIDYPIKIQQAIETVSNLYIEIIEKILLTIISGQDLPNTPQHEDEASYSLWRDEDDYMIDWSNDASFIKRFIDSVGFPYMGASTLLNQQKIRILDAEVKNDLTIVNRDCGKVIFTENGKPVIVCGRGLLKIMEAYDDGTKENSLPLKKFRSRFK